MHTVPIPNLNWSCLAHVIGDMHDDEEYQRVAVLLPDGSVVYPDTIEKDAYGQWRLVASTAE